MQAKKVLMGWVLLLAASLVATPASADNLKKLVRRADMIFRSQTSAAVFEMHIKTKSFDRSYKMVAWDDSRGRERTLIRILGPAAWRGHATLKVGEQLRLFNPKTNHVQVVGHSMLGSSWMGSHFSNDDLVKETRLSRDYSLALDKKWSASAPVGGAATYYRVRMTPKPTAPVAWGRIEYTLWENSSGIMPVKADYFRRLSDAKAARTMSFADVSELAGRYVPVKLKVTLASKPGEYTTIVYKKLKLDVNIPASKFTEQAMK